MNSLTFIAGAREEIPAKYLEQLFALMLANYKEILRNEPPKIDYYRTQWTLGASSEQKLIYVLAINQEDNVVGYGYASWNIAYDNLDKGYFWVHVTRIERRKGLGKQILKKILEIYPSQVTGLVTEVFVETDGVPFVESLNMEKKYTEILSSADLTQFNLEEIKKEAAKQKQQALEQGYEIIYIEGMEHVLHLDFVKYIEMSQEIWNDMPLEELSYEDEILSVERYREMLQRQLLSGNRILSFVTIHKETNEPVGLTVTHVNKYHTEIAHQMDTGVVKAHRGNGLGLALKYQMLEKLLAETTATSWQTGNAGSNEHMLRINDALNHKPLVSIPVYEMSKADLLKNV